jgi:hypothetical protein
LIAKLNAELREGIDELDRGEGIPGDEVFGRVDALIVQARF